MNTTDEGQIASLNKEIKGWRKIHQEDIENNNQICKTLDAIRLDSAAIHELADRQAEGIELLKENYKLLEADYEQKWGLSNRLQEQIAALTAKPITLCALEQIAALEAAAAERDDQKGIINNLTVRWGKAVRENARLQKRGKVLIQRLQSHGDIETDKEESLRDGEVEAMIDDLQKIPSEIDLTYRRKICRDCKKEFEGNDYHAYCHECFDKNYSDPYERGFYHDD